MAEKDLRPGEKADTTGVYEVRHDGHRAAHEVTILEGQLLPSCRQCGPKVRFRLLRAAAAMEADRDFGSSADK